LEVRSTGVGAGVYMYDVS